MDMTPEKLAFIKGQSQAAAHPQAASPVTKVEEKTIDVAVTKKDTESGREPTLRSARRAARRPTQETPGASEVLDQVLVPVTIRLPHRTAQALRRAYLEQRLKHAKPDTQQEIVEEALGDWLRGHEFLE
jgi:hypothetical protein